MRKALSKLATGRAFLVNGSSVKDYLAGDDA